MKKAINKSEREHILIELVTHACMHTSQQIARELHKIRHELHKNLLSHWEHNLPGISRADQLKLIQERAANTLNFKPCIFGLSAEGKTVSEGEFVRLAWSNTGITDSVKARLSEMAGRIVHMTPRGNQIINDGVGTSWQSNFAMATVFPDIIQGFQPSQIYRKGSEPKGTKVSPYADKLVYLHDRAMAQLKKLKELIFSAEDMYQELAGVIAPLKTAQALAEAMPEAVKHFPASLTYVKPTKEIADPKAINEIRAKLKKGLPI